MNLLPVSVLQEGSLQPSLLFGMGTYMEIKKAVRPSKIMVDNISSVPVV